MSHLLFCQPKKIMKFFILNKIVQIGYKMATIHCKTVTICNRFVTTFTELN